MSGFDADFIRPWWPRRLSGFDGKWWQPTGRWAWFRTVVRIKTFWRETYYCEVEHFVSSKPWSKP